MTDVLDKNTETPERSLAALFLPEDSFMGFSNGFYEDYGYLMPERVGVVAQIGQPTNNKYEIVHPVDTLILDARVSGTYTWQFSRADRTSTFVSQITGNEDGLTASSFRIDAQGRTGKVSQLSAEGSEQLFLGICLFLQDPRTKAAIEERVRLKAQAIANLERFRLSRTIVKDVAVMFDDGTWGKERTEVKLQGKGFEKEFEKRRAITAGMGFVALRPYDLSTK